MTYENLHINVSSLQMRPYIDAMPLDEGSTGTGDG